MVDSDPLVPFGENLRLLRKKTGLNQEQLATQAGLDRTYVSGVERGERNISLRNICRIADALKVDPKVLLDFEVSTAGCDLV